jgi:hypothetical protein
LKRKIVTMRKFVASVVIAAGIVSFGAGPASATGSATGSAATGSAAVGSGSAAVGSFLLANPEIAVMLLKLAISGMSLGSSVPDSGSGSD